MAVAIEVVNCKFCGKRMAQYAVGNRLDESAAEFTALCHRVECGPVELRLQAVVVLREDYNLSLS